MIAVGIDGFAGGWIAVALDDGRFLRHAVGPTITAVLAAFPTGAAFGIDIPIGPPAVFPRPADSQARRFVAPLGSTVFPTPPRVVLETPGYAEANGRMRELKGHGLSRQSFPG